MTDEIKATPLEKVWFGKDVDIYCSKVLLFIGSREDMCATAHLGMQVADVGIDAKAAAMFAERLDKQFDVDGDTDGDFISVGEGVWVLRIGRFDGSLNDTLVLNHECLHAALAIMDWCGVRESPPFEGLCYLHESIFRKLVVDAGRSAGALAWRDNQGKEVNDGERRK